MANNTWPSEEKWRFCIPGSAGIAARVIAASIEVGLKVEDSRKVAVID